jgi:parallel beta-helix repeat protein
VLPNTSHGIDMVGADGNTIEDNTIASNTGAGLNFRSGADDNTIRGNTITGNGGIGIAVSGGQRDRFTENGIHANGSFGIDLGVNGVDVNDPLDADVAPGHNDKQNYPVLSMVTAAQVTGTLNSAPETSFTVELFASPSCDASGNGEGATFLGAVEVVTDVAGDADVMFALPPAAAGQVITATATAPNGNTSEFSACTGPVPGGSTSSTSTIPTSSTSTTSSSTSTSTSTSSSPSTSSSTVATTTAPPSTLATTTTLPTSSTTTTTSSTSTTTTSSSTSSSAPVTTTTHGGTTSTTLGDPCGAEPVGPTFRSINCRLAATLAQVVAASDLGSYQDKLRRLLERAKAKKEEAEGLCGEPDLRHAKKRIQQSGRWVEKVGRTLRAVRARKNLPPARRAELLAAADGIRADLRTLGGRVRCPDDAR